ncbi:MAG TPA: hypothetical protein VM286_07840 [Candidatus Thermoplasmatota archaeon]|nr:hypothetical protein [Candidatus Thermoplasmatota archaeon]
MGSSAWPSILRVAGFLLLVLVLVAPAGAAALAPPASPPPGVPGPAQPLLDAHPRLMAAEYLANMGLHLDDPAYLRLAMMAQLEAQGAIAPGTVAHLARLHEAALAVASLGPPVQMYVDSYPICDLDKDGRNEIAQMLYNVATMRPQLRVVDGATGTTEWIAAQSYWYPLRYNRQILHDRPGDPQPDRSHQRAQDFATAPDLNGDGTCDLVFFTWAFDGVLNLVGIPDVTLQAVDSQQAFKVIWSQNFQGLSFSYGDPLQTCTQTEVQNFPSGFLPFMSPTGPQFAFQTSDIRATYCQDPLGLTGVLNLVGTRGRVYLQNLWVTEHIQLHNTSTGATYWQRDLAYSEQGKRTNITWVTAVGDVVGDAEPELLLDQMWITNPRGTQTNNPVDGSPLFRFGKGMDVLALAGEHRGTGATAWTAVIWDDGVARVNPPQQEQSFEEMVWTDLQVLPDLTGDHRADPVALVLTLEGAESTTSNGNFRTHFVPLDGATGALLWGNDVKFQGWGFIASLQPGNATDLLGIGTVDLPDPARADCTPTMDSSCGETGFPLKQVRLAALKAKDGSPLWTYQDSFAQDSYVSYDLALQQYHDALAPLDLNHDGILDPITPSQYVGAKDGTQLLLSTAKSAFDVLDGATGSRLLRFEVFGSNGYVLPCAEGAYTLASGYAQHLEVSRILPNGTLAWSMPTWVDPSATSATYGMDMTFLSGRCLDMPDGRTMVGLNAGLASFRRGLETLPMYGFPHAEGAEPQPTFTQQGPKLATASAMRAGDAVWFVPNVLERKALIEEALALLRPAPPPTLGQRLGWGLTPAIPGLMLGVSFGLVRNRKVPVARVPKRKLPDLYAEDK